jgi:hypothetical protein
MVSGSHYKILGIKLCTTFLFWGPNKETSGGDTSLKGMGTSVSSLMKLSNINLTRHIPDCPGCRALGILLLKPLQSEAACDWT